MKPALLAVFCGLTLASNLQASIITFDNTVGNNTAIPNGYGGLNWNNFFIHTALPSSGYIPVSGTSTAYNGFGTSASVIDGTFDFNSAYMTAAWNDNLQVTVIGKLGGTTLYNNTYTVSATTPTLINFNYLGIDEVLFSSTGGTPHPGYIGTGSGTQFSMDNMEINAAVPEPSTMIAGVMLLLPFGATIARRLKARNLDKC